jgi:SAM-dependent methyltransferase
VFRPMVLCRGRDDCTSRSRFDFHEVIRLTVRDLIRPVPGVRRVSLLRQQLHFRGSASFWEQNYSRGYTSGSGSYGVAAERKAEFLNSFVREHGVQSVVEFGCGDGNQLSLATYPRYVGLDVSRTAISLCRQRFAADVTKSFFLYDGACFVDHAELFSADLAISLDVVYHLIEDEIFETYMAHLFAAAKRFAVVYSTDEVMTGTAPHVRHRTFSRWIQENRQQWQLIGVTRGPNDGPGRADFFAYQRVAGD